MRSLEDLIDCQEGREETPYVQEGKREKMSPHESLMKLEVSLNQREEMTKKEDQKSILMIGGIKVFLPYSPVEAIVCVANAAKTERQPAVTIKEMEKMSEASQGKEEEHTVEMLTPWEKELEMLED
jgi:hypothetical protein